MYNYCICKCRSKILNVDGYLKYVKFVTGKYIVDDR